MNSPFLFAAPKAELVAREVAERIAHIFDETA